MELAQTSCFQATEAVIGIYSYLMHSRIPSPVCPLLQAGYFEGLR